MKSIDCWRDLEQFGINRLTGEACAYGMRQLCDVNTQGASIIREFLGLGYNTKLAGNWNSRVNGEPSVGSVMLPYEIFGQLAVFCLLSDGAAAVSVSKSGKAIGFYPEDD